MSLFEQAKETELKHKQELKLMDTPLKELDEKIKEKVRQEHWSFLDDLETILLSTSIFSSNEKYDILTKFQNKIEYKIGADIYLKEIVLNKKK
jgi:ABC-type sugar transport system ATPase subunit